MPRVLAAMSGGVDSAAAAVLLLRQGYDVQGATLRLLDTDICPGTQAERDIADAAAVCRHLGIVHHVVDGRDAFRRHVIQPFAKAYQEGLTPNPCLGCNRDIKTGLLLDWALTQGFDAVATGHYACMHHENGAYAIHRASYLPKDQSYVLYALPKERLSRLMLPLGTYQKDEVRTIAGEAGLSVASRGDSQDICFIQNEGYDDFLRRNFPADHPGDMLDEAGQVVGRHGGLYGYTVGQRKGLGGFGKPTYVLAKDAAHNRLIVGGDEGLWHSTVRLRDVNWHTALDAPFRAMVKLRYNHQGGMAVVSPTEAGAELVFDQPQRAPAPGQAAVFYDDTRLLGGGLIL